MEHDSEELEMQNHSSNEFNNLIDGIKEHPKEVCYCALSLAVILGITNIIQWFKRSKEQKRHEKVENLHKYAIQKQNAQIQDCKNLLEENERLKKLSSSLCDALVKLNEGGVSDDEG